MKKYLVLLFGIVLILLFTGCSNEKIIRYPKEGRKENWKLTGQTDNIADVGINIKQSLSEDVDNGKLPICYSKAYGAIYYINYSDNSYIYRCKDNETEVAVKIPSDHLYMKDGELYFRIAAGDYKLKGMSDGDICKYSPTTGEINKIIENATATWMIVLEEGIYYKTEESNYYYDFEKGVAEKVIMYPHFVLWKDKYCVVPYCPDIIDGSGEGFTGLGLHKVGDDYSKVEPIILGNRYDIYCVQQNVLYCSANTSITMVELDTGKVQYFGGHTNSAGEIFLMGDFTAQNNKVYPQNLSYYLDSETGESYDLYKANAGHISRLFNINEQIYAIYYKDGIEGGKPKGMAEIVEVVIDDEITLSERGKEVVCVELKKIGEK